ncbi:hypothetical protein [Fodinicola feengrottensis]|uniref:hypothetical protein n=1 Tax=Fodinicola feengrottensis TaxID=435914 RepID=UPI0013D7AFA4|nr:hypothetical protein [Fodinicola feengrottensis]
MSGAPASGQPGPVYGHLVSGQPGAYGHQPVGPGAVPAPPSEEDASTVQVHQTQVLPMGQLPIGRASVSAPPAPQPTGQPTERPTRRPTERPTERPTGRPPTGHAAVSSPPAPLPPVPHPLPPAPQPPVSGRTTAPSSPPYGYGQPQVHPTPQPHQPPYQPPPPRRRSKTPLVIIGIVLALALAAGAGIVVVLSLNHDKANTATPPTPQPTYSTNPSSTGTPAPSVSPVSLFPGYLVPVPATWERKDSGDPTLIGYGPLNNPDSQKIRISFSNPGGPGTSSALKVFQDGSEARADAAAGRLEVLHSGLSRTHLEGDLVRRPLRWRDLGVHLVEQRRPAAQPALWRDWPEREVVPTLLHGQRIGFRHVPATFPAGGGWHQGQPLTVTGRPARWRDGNAD